MPVAELLSQGVERHRIGINRENREDTSMARGDGRVYSRSGSPWLWISYYCRGRENRESAKTTDREEAEKLLRRRIKQVGADQIGVKRFLGPAAERVKMNQLFDALEVTKKNNGALVCPAKCRAYVNAGTDGAPCR